MVIKASNGAEIPLDDLREYLSGNITCSNELIEAELDIEGSGVADYVNQIHVAVRKCLNSEVCWPKEDEFEAATARTGISGPLFANQRNFDEWLTSHPLARGFAAIASEKQHPQPLSILLRSLFSDTATFVKRQLAEQLGDIAERFRASTAAIFKLDGDDRLRSFIRHNQGDPTFEPKVREHDEGVVGHVAFTQRGYCAPDTKLDPHHVADVPDMRSELVVPLVDPTNAHEKTRLLGVLNLQAREPNWFSWADVDELQAAAGELVSNLLVWNALDANDRPPLPWHPELHGWDLSRILQGICHAVAEEFGSDSAMCSIWYLDDDKDSLFVYATSGYDIEYKTDCVLPIKSRTGDVATKGERGRVQDFDPGKDFVRKNKAKHMGLKEAFICPIWAENPDGSQQRIGALNIYFRTQGNNAPAFREFMASVAELIGVIAGRFDEQRPRIAASQLHHLLYEMPRSSESDFEVIRDLFKDVFDADGCTIFAELNSKLYCTATTGLQWRDKGSAEGAAGEAWCYKLKGEEGFTIAVANHPGKCVRMNNVLNGRERGLPNFLPKAPLLKYRENFSPRNDDNRRLLALAVTVGERQAGSAPKASAVARRTARWKPPSVGVFRLLRRPHSKPFTICEEHLLSRLANLCKNAFNDWRRSKDAQKRPVKLLPAKPAGTPAEISAARLATEAAERIIRPLPGGRASRTLIDEVLRDVFACCRGYGVTSTALRIRSQAENPDSYRRHGYFSEPDPKEPVELIADLAKNDPFKAHYLPLQLDYIKGRSDRLPIAIAATTASVDLNGARSSAPPTAYGIRMPVMAWSNGTVLDGVLQIDLSKPVTNWDKFPKWLLSAAVGRLEAIWSMMSDEVFDPFDSPMKTLNPKLAQADLNACMESCRNYVQRKFEVDAHVYWRSSSSMSESFERTSDDPAMALFGILRDPETSQYAIPLRVGPIPAAYLLVKDDGKRIRSIVETATSIWSPLTIDKNDFRKVEWQKEVLPKRTAGRGSARGRYHVFWGASTFPRVRGSRRSERISVLV